MDCMTVGKIGPIKTLVCLWCLRRLEALSRDARHLELCGEGKWPLKWDRILKHLRYKLCHGNSLKISVFCSCNLKLLIDFWPLRDRRNAENILPLPFAFVEWVGEHVWKELLFKSSIHLELCPIFQDSNFALFWSPPAPQNNIRLSTMFTSVFLTVPVCCLWLSR